MCLHILWRTMVANGIYTATAAVIDGNLTQYQLFRLNVLEWKAACTVQSFVPVSGCYCYLKPILQQKRQLAFQICIVFFSITLCRKSKQKKMWAFQEQNYRNDKKDATSDVSALEGRKKNTLWILLTLMPLFAIYLK